MKSTVTEYPAAPSSQAVLHFARKLSFETDCWDVREAMANGRQDFVLLDVRGPSMYAHGHVAGAINLPHGKITGRKIAEWPSHTVFVVYCAGPHCNGSTKAALRLTELGRPVKEMIGGIIGWLDEGFELVAGEAAGAHTLPALAAE
jgi:rhodanese-related sulfurtransferase